MSKPTFAQESRGLGWELKLSSEITDTKTCERVLAEFSRYCAIFSYVEKDLHPGWKDWERGGIQYARFDFDADGQLDLFVRAKAWCGTLGCSNFIIFDDIAGSGRGENYLGTYLAHSHDPVFLHFVDIETLQLSLGTSQARFDLAERKVERFRKIKYE